jgi:hypothetical protein
MFNHCRLNCHTNLQLPEEHPPHSSCSMSCRFENTHSRWPRITHAVHASTKMKVSKTGIQLHRILKSLILNVCPMNVDFRWLIFYFFAPWGPQGLIHYTLAMQRNNDNVTKKRTTPEAAMILIMVAWQPNRVNRGQEPAELNIMRDVWLQPRSM